MENANPENCIVRVDSLDGRPQGTGFVITPTLVVTCAHVVEACGAKPGEQVRLTFHASGTETEAEVLADGWHRDADVAFLKLPDSLPPSVPSAILGPSSETEGHSFRTIGYPRVGSFQDVRASGEILGHITDERGVAMLQLRSQEIAQGMSGAPVLDVNTDRVVGMVTSTYIPLKDPKFRDAAFAISSETVRDLRSNELRLHCPAVKRGFVSTKEQQRALHNRRAMLKLVKKTWIKGVLEQSLHGAAMIELGLEEQADAVERPWDMVLQRHERPSRTLPPGTKVIDVFDEMNGFLLILGEPGSGKTTMLLELARDAIDRAERDHTQPIPVVFNLSSWAEKRLSIADWLVEELTAKYLIQKNVARPWVENDELLLLLDGLDEVNPERREACVSAINEFRQEHGLVPLAIASRIGDYEALTVRLKLQGAVRLQPLTPQQIDDFLAGAGIELLAVRKTLTYDTTLQELARSPLMLSIMVLAYQGMEPKDLGSLDTVEARRKHLFDIYIERMLKRRDGDRRYAREIVKLKLSWLAKTMEEHGTKEFFIEQMQPNWLDTTTQRRLYAAAVWLVIGLTFGLPFGLAFGYFLSNPDLMTLKGLVAGLTGGLVIGLGWTLAYLRPASKFVFGLRLALVSGLAMALAHLLREDPKAPIVAFYYSLPVSLIALAIGMFGVLTPIDRDRIQLVERLEFSWQRAKMGLIIGLVAGQVIQFILVLYWRMDLYELVLPKENLATGLTVGLISGLTGRQVVVQTKTEPNQGIRRSAMNGIVAGLLGVVLYAVQAALTELFGGFNIVGARGELGFAVLIALSIGAIFGGITYIQHYVLRGVLFFSGCIPWRLVHFLDYATECIFLRKVGGGYIFIHRLLQDYFASLTEEDIERLAEQT